MATMDKKKNVQHINLSIDETFLNDGAARVLETIRPEWKIDNIEFKMLTDGITNKLVRCKLNGDKEDNTVLIRVYGNKTDLLIDRKAETRNIILLNKVDLAPRLYATFNNGLAYEFVPGCTLSDVTVIKPEIYLLVATRMAKLHQVQIPNTINPEPMLWDKLDAFLQLVPDVFSDVKKQERFETLLVPTKSELKNQIKELKEKLIKLNSPIVFAHNDLLLGNVIFSAEKNAVTFIDYEYAAYNYQAFDLGNHFAEFVGIDNVDYSKYPNKEFQLKWLRHYLSTTRSNVSDKDVEKLYVQVNQFTLISHVLWGVWALIQAEHSYIDFDFISYASVRLNEYYARKESFLSLELPR